MPSHTVLHVHHIPQVRPLRLLPPVPAAAQDPRSAPRRPLCL